MQKEKHQPISKPTGELKTSSTLLTLRQLKKEAEKKEAAAEAAKVRCRICGKEIIPTPRCFGHGGGGGGSDSGNASEEKVSQGDDKTLIKVEKLIDDNEELIGQFSSMEGSERLDSESDDKSFDPEVIAELVAKGVLVINNDSESMTLTINLPCDPKLLSDEQRETLKQIMEAIIKVFNAFREQHHLSDDCINMIQDEDGNIRTLRISMPTRALYEAFIQQLDNNLWLTPSPTLQTKDEHKEVKCFVQTPFSIEPKPSNKSNRLIEDETNQNEGIASKEIDYEEREIFSPSPFVTKLKLG